MAIDIPTIHGFNYTQDNWIATLEGNQNAVTISVRTGVLIFDKPPKDIHYSHRHDHWTVDTRTIKKLGKVLVFDFQYHGHHITHDFGFWARERRGIIGKWVKSVNSGIAAIKRNSPQPR